MRTRVPNAFVRDGRIYTVNLASGAVYGERIVRQGGREYREWSPARSKLAEYLRAGGPFPAAEDDGILYLGAGSGTTVSHVSDVLRSGTVYAVEVAPIPYFRLLEVAGSRPNVVPILSDARHPERFSPLVGPVAGVYQDLAQRDQVNIFAANMGAFGARWGILMLKTRSISQRDPDEVAAAELAKLEDLSVSHVDISGTHPDHRAYFVAAEPSG